MPKSTASADSAPAQELVVIEPFADRAKGDAITDPAEVAAVLAGEWSQHVVMRQPAA